MTPADPGALRAAIRQSYLADEGMALERLVAIADLDAEAREAISARAADLVGRVRAAGQPSLMETFLVEYGLSTREGVALMCLAEALLRVPDPLTINALIQDKIAPADWGRHLGQASSSLVNASTWALMLTGRVLSEHEEAGLVRNLRGVVRRLGEPVVRTAVGQAMRLLGSQFVLGRTIEEATERARRMEEKGYAYSYDMLGEAARTDADARRYHLSYSDAITALAQACRSDEIRDNPGISVKLSALHPRYEYAHRDVVLSTLARRAASLALLARSANMGFNIDAEEADRLDLSLDVIEALLSDPALEGWDGFGVVVQAYGPRAAPVLDWLYDLAGRLDRRIMVRLVKGAYWDSEIKRAQVLGLDGFPVFTRKATTDVSYIACARKLLGMTDRIYPQFATHNAHTVAAVLQMAGGGQSYEFQRLHGMGEALHETVRRQTRARCRIYAPVGAHRDLLAYLVRRLLENGANSSFVHQIVNEDVTPEEIAEDPFARVAAFGNRAANPAIAHPSAIFGPDRTAARGWDLTDPVAVSALAAARDRFREHRWRAEPMLGTAPSPTLPHGSAAGEGVVANPARPSDIVGTVVEAGEEHVAAALEAARAAFPSWADRPVEERAQCLERIAALYEEHAPELMAIAAREAGKAWLDSVAEVREAVDFCRYYAAEARRLERDEPGRGRGVFVCISPWNFPLAIFTGQIAAALVTGNTVIAKPAEQTALMAARAVALMREAGVPPEVLQLLPGDGARVGGALVGSPGIAGVCFTGSIETARAINRGMAKGAPVDAALIAETGGVNAMIVDSTALPEQAVRDILASAFQSAGQRCSALRMLYVQEDVADRVLEMLAGAMAALRLGDPWDLATDIGPVIDAEARDVLLGHSAAMEAEGRLVKKLAPPKDLDGHFVPPAVYRLPSIEALEREFFGPILHVASFEARDLDRVVDAINAKGYGLTFGLHTRVDARVQQVVERLRVGNVYVNRNQIGAVVGSQPFGGEGLSGTGPKAGGPHYLPRFRRRTDPSPQVPTAKPAPGAREPAPLQPAIDAVDWEAWVRRSDRVAALSSAVARLPAELAGPAQDALAETIDIGLETETLPGPTGESNRLSAHARGVFLCLGRLEGDDGGATALLQAVQALALGNGAVAALPGRTASALTAAGAPVVRLEGTVPPEALGGATGLAGVAAIGPEEALRRYRAALAARDESILPLVVEPLSPRRYLIERAICIDTTAAGGNATLFAEAEEGGG